MSLLDRLIWGSRPEKLENFSGSSSPASPLSPFSTELARRVAVFRGQLEDWIAARRAAVPVLALPDAPEPRLGQCVSCGASIPEERWRCSFCLKAVYLVLGIDFAVEEA